MPGKEIQCNDHNKMFSTVIETKAIVTRMEKNISDLYDKNEARAEGISDLRNELSSAINKTSADILKKLNDLQFCIVKDDADRNRRKLDAYKSTGKKILKTLLYLVVAGAGGGGAYAAIQSIILKIWG